MKQELSPQPGTKINLRDFDPRRQSGDWNKESGEAESARNAKAIGEMAYRLYAEERRALLLVLQGMDTSGKDGTIRHVLTDVSPQGCQVTSFKAPTSEELAHDFLWRIHKAVPRRGQVGIFNRSHYEDVLIVRVHSLVPEDQWKRRYDQINDFEKLLVHSGVAIVKCYLHISREEQRERLQARLDDPTKLWKFRRQDIEERQYWRDYEAAYDEALTRCNTEHARWHIVPSDRKWERNLIISQIVREKLEEMNPQFPEPEPGLKGLKVE